MAKNELQELLQKRGLRLPEYDMEDSTGPSHCPCFVCRVTVGWVKEQELVERGEASRKKEAQQNAASRMLQRIRALEGGTYELEDMV